MDCLAEDTILDLLEGRLDAPSLDLVTRHLDACAECSALVRDSGRGLDSGAAPLVRGQNVGRYVVFGPVGSGSMGTVYAAYDPELDRKVALKLLRTDVLADRQGRDPSARLLREAQALAKLSHPNVVTVHDVGKVGDQLFIAIELVEGSTLVAWLLEEKRSLREVLRVFGDAGEGLAAAHAAGIVHRDFKPDNVLVGADGRVRVGDFGLARTDGSTMPTPGTTSSASLVATRAGTLVGTPAYMAPEQWDGKPTDARGDIFSFSVALFEALYGVRPFPGDDAETLARNMRDENVVDVPARSGTRVPAWLRRVLLKGLRADPEARWPTMRPLLDALANGPVATRQRVLLVALALAGLGVLGVMLARPQEPRVCTGAPAAWGELWGPPQKAAVKASFDRSGRPEAGRAFAEIDRAFEQLHERWTAMYTDACVATHVRREQSEALLDLRLACLDDRRREAVALQHVLAEADGETVDRWSDAVAGLGGLDVCANAKALTGPLPVPKEPRADRLGSELARARALYWAGKYPAVRDVALPVAREAGALGIAPLGARALLLAGDAEQRLLAFDAADKHLHDAVALGMIARDDALLADAWILLVRVDGFLRGRPREADLWASYAEAALARMGGDDEREATRLRNLAIIDRGADHVGAEKIALLERARTLYARSREPARTYYLSNVDETLAASLYLSGRIEEALQRYHATEVARVSLFGRQHPSVALALGNQADCLLVLGRADESLAKWQEATAITEASGGDAMWTRTGQASALRKKGELQRALAEDALALGRSDATSGEGWLIADALTSQGKDLLGLGRAPEAVAALERAVEIRERGTSRVEVLADTRFALARALVAAGGDRRRARALADAARSGGLVHLAQQYGSFYASALVEIDTFLATLHG